MKSFETECKKENGGTRFLSATWAGGFGSLPLPYLFRDSPSSSFAAISKAGFGAVELLLAEPDYVDGDIIEGLLDKNHLSLSAFGTGGAYVVHGLRLCGMDTDVREKAEDYIRRTISLSARFGAVTILGSVMGFSKGDCTREEALSQVVPAIRRLADFASEKGSVIMIEPLNRYECSIVSNIEQGLELLERVNSESVKLLVDCFHMNIEESSIAESIRKAGTCIGHVHISDSNRQAPGFGHIDFSEVFQALRDIAYKGYVSIEAFPLPDSESSAREGARTYRKYFNSTGKTPALRPHERG
jgi:sugar phosphate isomerase/epimerase